MDHYYDLWKSLQSGGDSAQNKRNRATTRMQQNLIAAQELGDEKMHIVVLIKRIVDETGFRAKREGERESY